MVWRKWVMVVVLLMVGAVGVIPAQAAGEPWTAWLYENQIGRVTRVDNTGALLSQFQLPADVGSTFSRNVAISADGMLLGYSATSSAATFVNVFDLSTFTTVYSVSLSPNVTTSLEFSANALNFSEGDSTFAFSYTETGSSTGWQIMVVDLVTFSTSSLTEDDPAVTSMVSSPAFGFLLPVVTYNRDQEIKFMMIPLGTDGAPRYDAYTWNIASNSITANEAYITPDTDTLPLTGEVINTVSDSGFPESNDPTSGYPSSNTLQVFDPATNERFVVMTMPRIFGARFIQGGELVALVQYSYTPDGVFSQTLQILDRSGAVKGVVNDTPSNDITTLLGTLNGLIFTAGSSGDSGGTTLYTVETRSATAPYTAVPVWESLVGANAWLAWVSDAAPATAESAFTAWGRLTPSVSGEPTTPPIAPPASSELAVGREATVQTTEGEVLNLRSAPDRTAERLGTVRNGTVVTLLEGPTSSSDGLFWWRVRLPSGTEGWVVESADGVQTLVAR